MAEFIAKKIIQNAEMGVDKGREKYEAYFVNTKIYAKYQGNVDTILETEGYGSCIVIE